MVVIVKFGVAAAIEDVKITLLEHGYVTMKLMPMKLMPMVTV